MAATMTSTTTTTSVFATSAARATSSTASVNASSSSGSCSSASRIVRFESECVLIPEAQRSSRRHLMATRTYSVPLWKRRGSSGFHSDSNDDPSSSLGLSSSPEDTHIVLKLPIPSFISSKHRSPSRSPTAKPLSPCIRHSPSGHFLVSPPSPIRNRRPRTPTRSPSLPLPTAARKFIPDPASPTPTTIPLRACCPDCFHITEESMKEGDHWKEKFTRGARRRRSSSLDSCDFPIRPPSPSVNCADARILSGSATLSGGFAAIACPANLKSTAAVVTSSRFSGAGTCAIAVDEVDRRRRSGSEPTTGGFATPVRVREASYSSIESDSSVPSSIGDTYSPIDQKPRASPIAEIDEDDEDQLFPLPSPKRSPSASPVPGSHRSGSRSPSIRSMNSAPPSPANSIPPSPNGSTACLNKSGSRDSLPSIASVSDEALPGYKGKARPKRKSSRCEKGFLSPPDPSSSRPRVVDMSVAEGDAPTSLPILVAPKPRHGRYASSPEDLRDPIPLATSISSPPIFPSSAPSPTSPLRSRSPTTRFQEKADRASPTRASRSVSASGSPKTQRSRSLSTQSGKRRRPSFSIPSPAGIFSDMLKGVSSMGMGGAGVSGGSH